jgi:cell division protein FtsZ
MDEQTRLFEKKKSSFTFDEQLQAPAKIVAMGIGGIGLKSVNHMVEAKIPGVELIALDTDIRELRRSKASIKLELGTSSTKGSGCNGNPKLGRKIALEEAERMLDLLKGCDMVFLIGGEGGGTFTGAAPIFTGLASEIGAIAIAMATMPLSLQGLTRIKQAEIGIRELKEAADAVIAISNEDLYCTLDEDVLLEDTFSFVEETFSCAVRDLTEIITRPGVLNLELSDVRTIMQKRRINLIGTGIAEGPNRASEAVQHAITNPLLGDIAINEVKSVLMNVTGSRQSLRLHETKSAAKALEELANFEDMIIGAAYDDSMEDRLKVTLIASGPFRDASEQSDNLELRIGTRDNVVAIEQSAQWDGSSGSRNKTNWEELDRPAFRRRHTV